MESELVPAKDIADKELNACIARIQNRLGIQWGDFASVYFSFRGFSKECKSYEASVQMLTDYITAEREFRREDG